MLQWRTWVYQYAWIWYFMFAHEIAIYRHTTLCPRISQIWYLSTFYYRNMTRCVLCSQPPAKSYFTTLRHTRGCPLLTGVQLLRPCDVIEWTSTGVAPTRCETPGRVTFARKPSRLWYDLHARHLAAVPGTWFHLLTWSESERRTGAGSRLSLWYDHIPYSIPAIPPNWTVRTLLVDELNFFAGKFYFRE